MLNLAHYSPSRFTNLIERLSIAEAKDSDFNVMLIPTHYITLYIPLNDQGFFYNGRHCKDPMLQYILQTPVTLKLPLASKMLGVRFYPFGIYPFYTNGKNNFKELFIKFEIIKEQVKSLINQPNEEVIHNVCIMLENLYSKKREDKTKLLKDFYHFSFESNDNTSVTTFCNKEDIAYMTLFRLYKKILGISPKKLDRLIKFRKSIDQLAHSGNKLVTIAFDSGYYDQAHFIREFNYFVRMSPLEYITYLKKENLYDFRSFINFAAF